MTGNEKLALSFSAANTLPTKLLYTRAVRDGSVVPWHVQLCPTNRCNLSCEFCSCSERDSSRELALDVIVSAMEAFARLGCRAVTITGGGEPLLHPDINRLLWIIRAQLGIRIGLVTNGTQFERLSVHAYNNLTWVRVSMSDDRPFAAIKPDLERICAYTTQNHPIDWAISYVLTADSDFDNLAAAVLFANQHGFTHVRIVADLLNLYAVSRREEIVSALHERNVSDDLVIYQERKEFGPGHRECWISLLKPVIGADGWLYPCCGVQYKDTRPSMDFAEADRMGAIYEIDTIWREQAHFDGSNCMRCYYRNYNILLASMREPIAHVEFV